MELPSLLGHCVQLAKVINKSPQSSDSIASQYFRNRKYIGSKERRFISETTFSYLRMKKLADYCSEMAINKQLNNFTNLKFVENNIIPIVATCLISDNYPNNNFDFRFRTLLEKTLNINEIDINKLFAEAIVNKVNISIDTAIVLINDIINSFDELCSNVEKILTKNNLSNQDLELLQYRFSIPKWILSNWINNNYKNLTLNEAAQLAESLLGSASLSLRVSTNVINRETAIRELMKEGIESHPGVHSPSCLILNKRTLLSQNKLFQSGLIEVQDEGSQLISFALAPENNDRILDACAGAGGKTLHLASLQHDEGYILATDIEYKRLKELERRAYKAGFKSIETKLLAGNSIQNKHIRIDMLFDKVLVDAPCSGSGTSRRMPMIKWRLNPSLLKRLASRQLEILNYNSQFVKNEGILVYATCSIMPDENDGVIERFLELNQEFSPDPLLPAFSKFGIDFSELTPTDFKLNLTPYLHGSDGFFIARMKKK